MLATYELETCVDQLFTRRGKITFDMFTKFCSSIANISPHETVLKQRIFVHALATCIKYNAKIELEHLINDYAQIYYDSCEKYPVDIRHNILAYCVVCIYPSFRKILIRLSMIRFGTRHWFSKV